MTPNISSKILRQTYSSFPQISLTGLCCLAFYDHSEKLKLTFPLQTTFPPRNEGNKSASQMERECFKFLVKMPLSIILDHFRSIYM